MCNVSVQSSIIHNHVQDYISSFVNADSYCIFIFHSGDTYYDKRGPRLAHCNFALEFFVSTIYAEY